MFFNFRVLVLKIYIFQVVTFFLVPCLSNQLIFSVAVLIYTIHVFQGAFSLPATIPMITKKVPFFLFTMEPMLGKHIHSSRSSGLSTQTTAKLKYWNQTDRKYSKNCCKSVFSTLLLRTIAITMRSKCSKNYFFGFY